MRMLGKTSPIVLLGLILVGCAESSLVRAPATDTTPPTVVATVPANGAENVTDARVVITFSEPMFTGSVRLEATPSVNWGTATWSDGDRTVTFVPADLRPNTRYTVRITGRDRAGNSLTGTTAFSFATGAMVQTGATAENLVRNRVTAAVDERVYAAFLAWVAGQPDRVLTGAPEEQRRLREVVAQRSAEAARRAREFFAEHPTEPARLVEYAFWLTADLKAADGPLATGTAAASPATPAQPRSPAPAGSPAPTAPVASSPQARTERPYPQGFPELVREVYEKAQGRELWNAAKPEHEQLAQSYRAAVEDRVRQASTYLRLGSFPFQRLVVVPNLLGPRDAVREVPVNGILHVVVGPSAGPNVRGIVRAFLRAVLEPAVAASKEEVGKLSGLYELVQEQAKSQGLQDWAQVVRESLVRAVEARLFLPNREEQDNFLDASFQEGLLLVRHFAGRLEALERGETSLNPFVQQALTNVNAEQLRQQWLARGRR